MRKEIRLASLPNKPVTGERSVYMSTGMVIGRTADITKITHLPDGSLHLIDSDGTVYTLPSERARRLQHMAG